MKKTILSLILTLIFVLATPITSVFAITYNDGGISKELKDVDLSVYKTENKTQLITLSEVGFNTSDYKIIVYVYNAGKTLFDQNTASNKINVATTYNDEHKPISYANFSLQYISKTEDNSIYKFAIVDDGNVLKDSAELQNTLYDERRYDVVGVQLLNAGNVLAKDNKVEKTYVYSGTADKLTLKGIKSIELEVHPVWYRTETSDKGANYQHQLNAVYFSVPNDYLKDGYQLDAVKAEWYEYKTEPIVVLDNKNVCDTIESFLGVDIGVRNENLPYSLVSETFKPKLTWFYNLPYPLSSDIYENEKHTSTLHWLFNDNKDAVIHTERLTNYINNYNKSAKKGYLPIKNGSVSADLFQDSVDEGRTKGYNVATIYANQTYDLLSYSDTHSIWDRLMDYGFWDTITGKTPLGDESLYVKPIYQVKDTDVKDLATINSNLLIDTELCSEFKSFYDNQVDRSTFLFRFSTTDYYSAPIKAVDHNLYVYDNGNVDFDDVYSTGYIAEETVFLDFDIIHLEFFDGNERLVVPVVSDPIDIIPSITPPPVFDNKWILYGIITIISLLGVGAIYSVIKKGAK